MRIDHVIYGAADLDAAEAAVEAALGVGAVRGGRHEGLGTHNRIVPLGGAYVELLAVADAAEASRSDLGRALLARIERGDGLLGWAVAVDDVAPVADRLGAPVTTIRREGFSAHLCGVAKALREPFLPFFIARDPGVPGPPAHGAAGGIAWLEVAGDAARLATWLGGASLPVRVVPGPPGVLAVGVGSGRELRA
jgi:glyoxalase-like protein